MKPEDTRLENEFGQELPVSSIEEFNTLQSFSAQPTSLLETTLTDTLGLSMHNAVTNQQQSQMTTAASITNACARLLQTKAAVVVPSASHTEQQVQAPELVVTDKDRLSSHDDAPQQPPKKAEKRFSMWRFLKKNKEAKDEGEASADV